MDLGGLRGYANSFPKFAEFAKLASMNLFKLVIWTTHVSLEIVKGFDFRALSLGYGAPSVTGVRPEGQSGRTRGV